MIEEFEKYILLLVKEGRFEEVAALLNEDSLEGEVATDFFYSTNAITEAEREAVEEAI